MTYLDYILNHVIPTSIQDIVSSFSLWIKIIQGDYGVVARNPNTPPEILIHLAEDRDWDVRAYVARNPNTPEYVKDYLNAMKFVRDYGL